MRLVTKWAQGAGSLTVFYQRSLQRDARRLRSVDPGGSDCGQPTWLVPLGLRQLRDVFLILALAATAAALLFFAEAAQRPRLALRPCCHAVISFSLAH